ncbi:hypothetical protein OROMI_010434 [Orobanche minor]
MSKTEGLLILQTQNTAAGGGFSLLYHFCLGTFIVPGFCGALSEDLYIRALVRDKAGKSAGPCPQIVARRTLADISNLPQKPRPLIQDNKLQSIPTTTKPYIEQLQKENMALVKMLGQRNKIIEQSGIELERLRLNLIKIQEQNQQLALSHTQMLVELNFAKDRLKALQHELGCKNGLLKARKLKGGEACEIPCQSADAEVNLIKLPEEGETSTVAREEEKPRNTKRRLRSQSFSSSEPLQSEENDGNKRSSVRRQSARFNPVESKSAEHQSDKDHTRFPEYPFPAEPVLQNGSTSGSASVENDANRSSSEMNLIKLTEEERGTSAVGREDEKPRNTKRRLRSHGFGHSEPLQPDEIAGNRRTSLRRQSTRFSKPVEPKPSEDPYDTKSPKGSLPGEPVLESGPTFGNASVENEDNRSSCGLKYECREIGRSSLFRPSRLAVKKVQSYKEIPLNVKMRRSN